MHQIAWDMRHGLPNRAYLDFVARLISLETGPSDPLAVVVDFDQWPGAYILREHVINEVNGEGFRIIVGPRGSGKTTLFRKALQPPWSGHTLEVRLHLSDLGTALPFEAILKGEVSLLEVEQLTRHIFNAYWDDFFHTDETRRERFLPSLRLDREWMTKLHWFYNNYPPTYNHMTDDFELMAWLRSPDISAPFRGVVSAQIALRELIQLITHPTILPFEKNVTAPYGHIELLIDGTEMLSADGAQRLIRDTERLYSSSLEHIHLKLYVDSSLLKLIEEMQCVQEGRAIVYQLPRWTEDELRTMLSVRLTAWEAGAVLPTPGHQAPLERWSERIPTLKPDLKGHFEEIIISNALQAPSYDDPLAAPIHLLRLARGLIAACAGCWEPEFKPPLDRAQVEQLAALYWESP